MVIWVNGAFGSGKTSTAYELKERLLNTYVYDPEEVGFFIRDNIPADIKFNDFQDIPMWREFNYSMLKYICNEYKGVIIVPMTIANEYYFNEIVERLRFENININHFTLMATKDTLIQRLRGRGDGENSWAEQQIDRCLEGLRSKTFEEHIYTDGLTTRQIVEYIAEVCDIELLPYNNNWLT